MEILPSNTEKQPEQDLNKAEPISEDKQHHVNAKRGRALLRKIDLHLMIPLWIVFVFGFLDRINLGNVSVLGILQELQMTGTDMADALQIFFVPYIISDVPSNVLLKRFAPSTWISMLTFFWVRSCCACRASAANDGLIRYCMHVSRGCQQHIGSVCMPFLYGSLRRRVRSRLCISLVHVL